MMRYEEIKLPLDLPIFIRLSRADVSRLMARTIAEEVSDKMKTRWGKEAGDNDGLGVPQTYKQMCLQAQIEKSPRRSLTNVGVDLDKYNKSRRRIKAETFMLKVTMRCSFVRKLSLRDD